MNHALVTDASIAVKWVLFEEFTDRARFLYEASLQAHRPLFVPPHFASEVTSGIYQRTRARAATHRITGDEAYEALRRFARFRVEILEPADLYERACLFARDNQIPSLYDSIYITLAQLINAELWTDDRALINSVGAVAPWIQ